LLNLLIGYTAPILGQEKTTSSFTLHSAILNEDRYFTIYVPSSPKGKLEVIYVLDGQAQFTNVVNALKQINQNQEIVVGIGNIWLRDRDYTPTHVKASAFVDSMAAAVSGGGEKFIEHLEKELIPYIGSHYQAGSSRILIGHSLGGMIAMEILLMHGNLFQKYLAIDPSMWWDDEKLLREYKSQTKINFPDKSVFLAIANTRNRDKNNIREIRQDTTQNTARIRPSLLLLDNLQSRPQTNFQLEWKYYSDQDHFSVFLPAVTDGLKYLLK
jgi:predicted alpha/beta superfamily hydrolase